MDTLTELISTSKSCQWDIMYAYVKFRNSEPRVEHEWLVSVACSSSFEFIFCFLSISESAVIQLYLVLSSSIVQPVSESWVQHSMHISRRVVPGMICDLGE